jgi:hypothetical protein
MDEQDKPVVRSKTLPVDDFTVKFGDLSDADKIERLRREAEGLNRAYGRLRNELELLKSRFQSHQHGHDGKPMVPADMREPHQGEGTWNKLA